MAWALIGIRPDAPAVFAELSANLWELVNGGLLVHDFEVYLPPTSTSRVRAWRAKKRAETRAGNRPVTRSETARETGGETPSETHAERVGNDPSHARAVPVPDPVPVPEPDTSHGSIEPFDVSLEVLDSPGTPLVTELAAILNRRGVRFTVTRQWHVEADRMIRIDKRELLEAIGLLSWATNHHFWASNILSIPKFREKYDQLRLQRERELTQPVRSDPMHERAQQLLAKARS